MADEEGRSGDKQDAYHGDDRDHRHFRERGSRGERFSPISRDTGFRMISIDRRTCCSLMGGKGIRFDPHDDIANPPEGQHVPIIELSRCSNLSAVYESAIRRAAI